MSASRLRWVRRSAQALAVGLVAGLLALLVHRVIEQNGSNIARDLRAGKRPPAPGFALPRLDGRGKLRLTSLRGRVVILNFWASWCDPCKKEAPRFEAAYRRWRSRGVVVVGVDGFDDFSGDAKHFVRKYGLTYPIVRDKGYAVSPRYGVSGYPETFVISPSGRIVKKFQGEVSRADLSRAVPLALSA